MSSREVAETAVGVQLARKKSWDGANMLDALKRLVYETEGMELVDWSILAIVFTACVLLWSMRKHSMDAVGIDTVLRDLHDCFERGARCL